MKAGRIVVGVLLVLVGAAAIAGSISILVDERDADDFFISHEQDVERSSFAVASEDVDVLTSAPGWLADWLTSPVDIRVRGASSGGGAIFFGIAETSDLQAYLGGVNYDEVTSLDFKGADIRYTTQQGTAPPSAPGTEGFWVTSVEGSGEQTLDWSLETGNWSVVVMNADASAGINATLVFGAKISNFVLLMWIGLAFGALAVLGGSWLTYRGVRPRSGSVEG
jgi:hypothetical protein